MGRYYAVLSIYGILALLYLVGARRAGALKCVFVASYCGVVLISFTTGTTASMWLVTVLLILLSWIVVNRRANPSFGSTMVSRLTYALFAVYIYGILVGVVRYDPSLEVIKAGVAKSFLGVPLRFLMAGYRTAVVISLFLAFSLPLRYYVDRKLFTQCLALCWCFAVVLSIIVIVDFAGIADLRLTGREIVFDESVHRGALGFQRATLGLMLFAAIFLTFAMTQTTGSYTLKMAGYGSLPVLIAALLFSFSRAAMLGMTVSGVSLVLTLGGRRAFKGLIIACLGAIVIAWVVGQFPEVRERATFWFTGEMSFYDVSSGRVQGWIELLRWISRNPLIVLTGCGFQNFNYYVKIEEAGTYLAYAHNNYLHILVEEGILGFIVFIVWMLSIFRWLVSWKRSVSDSKQRTIAGVMVSLMGGLFVTCLTQESLAPSPTVIPFTTHFYLILGLWVSYYRSTMCELYESTDMMVGEQSAEAATFDRTYEWV